MSLRAILLGAGLVGLAACGGGSGGGDFERAMAPAPEPMLSEADMQFDEAAPMGKVSSNAPTPTEPTGEPGTQQFIAYSHSLGLSLPRGGVDPMMAAHTQACQAAGPSTCIVINANIYSQDEAYASGNLSLRATPAWIDTFLGGVETATSEAGGDITQRSTRAEDLTRAIIDTGSRLEAQKTLQTRLLNLLERRDGDLGDLLQIEREVARVTGEIESIEAQLKTLRLRVSMSSLDINYQTIVPPFSGSRENPLGQAFGDFFYNLASAIAAVITAFAVGLPWILLLALFLWIWLKLIWPRLRGRKAKRPEA